ncbi:hypothetical protein QL996_01755 [Planococcus sp. APC 4015]|nr:hypothetical protein [Planococcus sp. APC 4015]
MADTEHENEDQNDELRTRFAAGETESMPPAPPSTAETVRKDTTYAPGSESETAQKQQDPLPDSIDDDIDADDVRAVPGTGGPDDVGDVDVDEDDLELPWRQ